MPNEPNEIDPQQRPRLERAWDRIETRIAALPAELREAGFDFLSRRRPGSSHRDYFSAIRAAPICYLPLWLRDSLSASGNWPAEAGDCWLQDMLLVTMWGYFYIRIQDDHLDEPEAQKSDLLFANICIAEMARSLVAALPNRPSSEDPIWQAWEEFTHQTLAEQRQLECNAAYPREVFEQHARKVAFARIPLLMVCMRANRQDLVDGIVRLIDALGITFGLINDSMGFKRDLANGHRTFLLARAGWSRPVHGGSSEPDEALLARLFEGGLLSQLEAEVRESREQVVAAAQLLGIGPAVEAWLMRLREEHAAWSDARTKVALVRALSSQKTTARLPV